VLLKLWIWIIDNSQNNLWVKYTDDYYKGLGTFFNDSKLKNYFSRKPNSSIFNTLNTQIFIRIYTVYSV